MSQLQHGEAALPTAPSPPLSVVSAPAPETGRNPRRSERGSLPRGRTWILIAADMLALAAALAITYSVAEALASPAIIAPLWLALLLPAVVLPVWVVIFTAYNLYERQNRSISLASFDELGELFHALVAGSRYFAGSWVRRCTSRLRLRCSPLRRSRSCCSSAGRCAPGSCPRSCTPAGR